MDRIEPLIPGVRNQLDIALGWIVEYKAQRDAEFAAHEATHFEMAWDFEYVAGLATTMLNAPVEARQAVCEEITRVMRDNGIWPPATEHTEPTA